MGEVVFTERAPATAGPKAFILALWPCVTAALQARAMLPLRLALRRRAGGGRPTRLGRRARQV
eukprot:11810176-Alexandrium_andersonii.AAC.1